MVIFPAEQHTNPDTIFRDDTNDRVRDQDDFLKLLPSKFFSFPFVSMH